MNRPPWTTVARAFRRTALPLVSYYTVTLVIPVANGTAMSDAFMEHAVIVLAVPPVAIMLACAVHRIVRILIGPAKAGHYVRLAPITGCTSTPRQLLP
jgi:hypothetical protein